MLIKFMVTTKLDKETGEYTSECSNFIFGDKNVKLPIDFDERFESDSTTKGLITEINLKEARNIESKIIFLENICYDTKNYTDERNAIILNRPIENYAEMSSIYLKDLQKAISNNETILLYSDY